MLPERVDGIIQIHIPPIQIFPKIDGSENWKRGDPLNAAALKEWIRNYGRVPLLDGAMGTLLAERGWLPPALPEEMNLGDPEAVGQVHKAYLAAGCVIIETNTFGGSAQKLKERGLAERTFQINAAAASIARRAAGKGALVAGSVGPLGELLKPYGNLSFEDAYRAFLPQMQGLAEGGADFFLIETMMDLQEAKAAVLAAKDAAPDMAFVVSFTFDNHECTVTGTPPEVAADWARCMGAAGVGANCGMGPDRYLPVVPRLAAHAGIPVFIYANAGLPNDPNWFAPAAFAKVGQALVQAGANVIGGCCGTTPQHMAALSEVVRRISAPKVRDIHHATLTSRSRTVPVGGQHPLALVGERINVWRKSPLRDEVAQYKWELLREEARLQAAAGAHVIDVNVTLPEIDQPRAMREAVLAVEHACAAPLSLDSDNLDLVEAGLAVCTGVPLVNSVSAKGDQLERGLRLAKRFGASLVVLAIDDEGIPETADRRLGVVRRIMETVDALKFPRSSVFVDVLTLAVGAEGKAPTVTLDVLRRVRTLGCSTILGISNVSHGMPARGLLNRTFLAMAMGSGLNAVIANPLDEELLATIAAGNLLVGHDPQARSYLAFASRYQEPLSRSGPPESPEHTAVSPAPEAATPCSVSSADPWEGLREQILLGEAGKSEELAAVLLNASENDPLKVVTQGVVPALHEVGKRYDCGDYFLPQLIAAAQAAQSVCSRVQERIAAKGEVLDRGKILLATVEGDLHDLGKNVVGTVLRSHGYSVRDLGKNVPLQRILDAINEDCPQIVGLSALMTTTMLEMERVVWSLHDLQPDVKVIVGGASVTSSFAEKIGASGFAPDAMSAVRLVERLLGDASEVS